MHEHHNQRTVGFATRVGLAGARRVDLAHLLDERARTFARGEHLLRRSIGQALVRLQAEDGFKRLGYSTQASYVTQKLGINCQSARDYATMERALQTRHALEAAYDAGEVSYSNVRSIIRETPAIEDAEWARRAKWLTVEQLNDLLDRERDVRPTDRASASLAEDKPAKGRVVEVNATPALLARWYVAVELVQRYEAADVPFHYCVQASCAEFLNGPGAGALREVLRKRDEQSATQSQDEPSDFPFNKRHLDSEADWDRLERDCLQLADRWLGLSWEVPYFHLPPFVVPRDGDTLRELDARLQEAARLHGQIHGHLRRLLTDIFRHQLFVELKFDTFDQYCQDRLSIGPSTAHALLRLHERLRKCPRVAERFDDGELTQRQAELLAQLVDRDTEHPWILHARQTTTRFLKEDVERALKLRAVAPNEFAKSLGLPDRPTMVVPDVSGVRKRTADAAMDNYRRASRASRKRLGVGQTCAVDAEGSVQASGDEGLGQNYAGSRDGSQASGSVAQSAQTCAGSPGGSQVSGRSAQTCVRPYALRTGAYPFETFRQSIERLLEEIAGENDHYASDHCVTRIRFWLPAELEELWQDAIDAARLMLGGWGGIADCLEMMLDAFLATWGDEALECLREHPILDRQGWKCAVPTCNRRANLHVHHLCPRAQGGGQEPQILVGLCPSHHLHGVHEGWIRVTGFAPDGLLWELGVDEQEHAVLNVDDRGVLIPLSNEVCWAVA